jgi:hypothetical protein
VTTPLSFTLPADAIGKEIVYVRIMGTGTELLSDKYTFTAGEFCGLKYATNSESGVGNVYILGDAQVTGIKGDVNGDGIVNGTDIQAVINFIVAGTYDEKADVNQDKIVNGTDIQEIINIIVGQE